MSRAITPWLLRSFQTALQNSPQNPDYISNLAKARMKLGDAPGAEQLFRRSLAISPSHQPSYHGLGELMLKNGRGQEAQQLMTAWAGTQPYIAESHVELAWVQRELGQHDAAAQSLQGALQVNPNHSTALAHLGQYYQDQGQSSQAIAMYQQSLRANWDQPEVQSRLAVAAAAAGPNHPMGEIAMARGVHPHSLPQTQMAFGSPNGTQPGQFAQAPMMGQPQFAWQPPQYPQQYQQQPGPMMVPQQMAGNHMPPFNPMAGMPLGFGMGGGPIETSMATPGTASSTAASSSPVPDPAFAKPSHQVARPTPVTSVSQSVELKDQLPPAIEAF